MRFILVFLLVLIASFSIAHSSEVLKTTEVVITATKTEAEVEDVPASIEIITKEEIKAKGAERLREIIRFADGVNFIRSMGRDLLSIRGMNPRHSLILIDGRRFAGEVSHDFEIDRLTLENVERIEIVRGPMSALYGSDALGGIINIITKKPDKFTFEFSPQYGFFGEGDNKQLTTSAYLGGRYNKFGFSLTGTHFKRDPYLRANQTSYLEDEERTNLALKLFYDFTKHTTLTLDTSYMVEDVESRSLSGKTLQRDINENKRYDFSIALSHKSPDLSYLLRAYTSIYDKYYENRTLATNKLNRFDPIKRRTSVVEGTISKLLLNNHLITAGAEYRQEFFRGTRVKTGKGKFTVVKEGVTAEGSEITLDYWAGYIQDEWQVSDNLIVVPSIRYDDSDKFESDISPKIGVTYKILPNLRVKASYGQGFKTPTPRDLYINMRMPGPRYVAVGNPDLKSENSETYEFALEGEKGIFTGRIAYFFNNVKNLIESVQVTPPLPACLPLPDKWTCYTFKNIAKAEIHGVEASIGINITKEFSLKGSYAFLDAKDKTNKQRLTMRPKHKVITKATYENQSLGLRGNIWGEYVGDNLWQVATATTPEKIKNYSLWYASISKDITKNIELYAGVDNIFNKKDEDIPLVGSFYYGGIRMKF